MGLAGLVMLSISLSVDALGIGLAYSIRKIKICTISRTIISAISLVVTYLSIFFGNFILKFTSPFLAKLIGTGMLFFYGLLTIIQGTKKSPANYDFNASKIIEPKEAFYVGFALSVDSFAGGLSYVIAGFYSKFVPFIVGILQFLFLSLGILLGKKLSKSNKIKANYFTVLAGIIFIILSVFKLVL